MRSWTIAFMGCTFLFISTILGCRREDSESRLIDTKYVLSKDDFFITGLYYRADSATVSKAIGLPDSIKPIIPSISFSHTGFSYWYYPDYQIMFNPMKRLDAIEVKHAGFLTSRGLSVGDTISRVRELYGRSDQDYDLSSAGLSYFFNKDDTTGIHIRIKNNRVISIYVGHFN